jgi:hypothetical protein
MQYHKWVMCKMKNYIVYNILLILLHYFYITIIKSYKRFDGKYFHASCMYSISLKSIGAQCTHTHTHGR